MGQQLKQPAVNQQINLQIIALIESIDLTEIIKEKAEKFSPKQMDHIFRSMNSDQLIFIELLGALLGALSGLAMIDLKIFGGFSVILFVFYMADYVLTKRRELSKA